MLLAGWTEGLIPGGGETFCNRPHQPWGPPSLLYNGYWVSFIGLKRPGCGIDHPLSPSTKAKERAELYLYSMPPRPKAFMACSRVNFTITQHTTCHLFIYSANFSKKRKVQPQLGNSNVNNCTVFVNLGFKQCVIFDIYYYATHCNFATIF